jgi:hypothetical protein
MDKAKVNANLLRDIVESADFAYDSKFRQIEIVNRSFGHFMIIRWCAVVHCSFPDILRYSSFTPGIAMILAIRF